MITQEPPPIAVDSPAAEPTDAKHLSEYVHSGDTTLRVDAQAGLLRGVKLIGLESKNGRRYRPAALRQAVALYENAKVNVNHPAGSPLAPRDYRDRLGVIRGVEFRVGEGLFGDLHFNPKHALAEQLAWDAEHNPRNVGFSHNVQARLVREGERTFVHEITHVQSVDLVADPATTQGLFEAETLALDKNESVAPEPTPAWDALTVETLRLHRPDLLDELQTMLIANQQSELANELQEAAQLRQRLARRERIAELVAEHASEGSSFRGTHASLLGEAFYQLLLDADEACLSTLVAERLAAHRSLMNQAPQSREQTHTQTVTTSPANNPKQFAAALKQRRP